VRTKPRSSFFVTGFGSGAYSAKLLAGTKHRFSGLSQARQCGDEVLRRLVTGGPPVRGGGGIPQRIITSSRSPASVFRTRRSQPRPETCATSRTANVPSPHRSAPHCSRASAKSIIRRNAARNAVASAKSSVGPVPTHFRFTSIISSSPPRNAASRFARCTSSQTAPRQRRRDPLQPSENLLERASVLDL
jgi:hypothetical protein